MIRRSKTDHAGKGFEREVSAVADRSPLCPVELFKKFVSMDTEAWEMARANNETLGAAHTMRTGRKMIAAHDIAEFWKVEGTKKRGRKFQYATHSLRAGGATAMLLNGVGQKVVMTLGRWRSDAFLAYHKGGRSNDGSRRKDAREKCQTHGMVAGGEPVESTNRQEIQGPDP